MHGLVAVIILQINEKNLTLSIFAATIRNINMPILWMDFEKY